MSTAFGSAEPKFFAYWRESQRDDDPQLDRWIQYEAEQLDVARERMRQVAEHINVQGKTLLDVGCQWGATSIAAAEAGAIPTGMDVDEHLAAGARIRAEERGVRASFTVGLGESMPFADNSFDVAICVNVLEHVADHRDTVRELVRVVKPGGYIYLDGPNRLAPAWAKSDPHFQAPGVSFLPNRVGEFVAKRLLKQPAYDVGVFPIAARVRRMLKESGAEIEWSNWGIASDSLLLRRGTVSGNESRLARYRAEIDFNLRTMFVFVARPL